MALKQKNSTLEEEQIQMIGEYGQALGNLDFSSALRVVIREWQEMKKLQMVGIGSMPRPVDGVDVPVVLVQQDGS